MRSLPALPAAVALFAAAALVSPFASAQTFPKSVQKQAAQQSHFPGAAPAKPAPQSLADRTAALNAILNQIWQDRLAHHPEFASAIGDTRYNDQLTDYSVAAYNEELARGRQYIIQLGGIDTTGMTPQLSAAKDTIVQQLVDQQQQAESKPWQQPFSVFTGPQVTLPELVPLLSFSTAKDYDDYAARLAKIPTAFQQVTDNAMSGVEDGRVPPKPVLDKVLAEVNSIAAAKPEDTPFAAPLHKFPASITAADQTRIRAEVLDAIRTKVIPAYAQLARFLTKTYIPASANQPNVWQPRD